MTRIIFALVVIGFAYMKYRAQPLVLNPHAVDHSSGRAAVVVL